jgi:hypothetical protein
MHSPAAQQEMEGLREPELDGPRHLVRRGSGVGPAYVTGNRKTRRIPATASVLPTGKGQVLTADRQLRHEPE